MGRDFERSRDPIAGFVLIPADALPLILQMMIGERFQFAIMHGTRLIRRQASLTGFRFETKLGSV
jgi:hypothetical protein